VGQIEISETISDRQKGEGERTTDLGGLINYASAGGSLNTSEKRGRKGLEGRGSASRIASNAASKEEEEGRTLDIAHRKEGKKIRGDLHPLTKKGEEGAGPA